MTPIEAAQKASQLSDRVLFIAVIVMLSGAILWIARYFLKMHEALSAKLDTAEDKFEKVLVQMVKDGQEAQKTIAVCVSRNTECIDNNTHLNVESAKIMSETSYLLKECRERINSGKCG
jgi:K+ transporter